MNYHEIICKKAYYLWLDGFSNDPDTNYFEAKRLIELEKKQLIVKRLERYFLAKENQKKSIDKVRKFLKSKYSTRNIYNNKKNILIKCFILPTLDEC